MNSTDPAEFEAYLRRFPNGMFSELAQVRLAALRRPIGGSSGAGGARVGGTAGASRPVETPTAVSADRASGSRPERTCAGQPAGAGCWMEISQKPGCYVWNGSLTPGATVTWTGECVGGLAQGIGTLTWVWDGNRQAGTGQVTHGEQTGNWVIRYANGNVSEGPAVGGMRNGNWVLRFADGEVWEGPYVDGKENGNWVLRYANGTVSEGPFVDAERTGNWVIRYADGGVSEGPLVDGVRTGNWVIRDADGGVSEGPYVDGERNGNWVNRYADGDVWEGPYVDGKENGNWVLRFANGNVWEALVVDGVRTGNWVIRDATGTRRRPAAARSEARVPAGWRRAAPGIASGDAPSQPGEVFRDCAACPEMVVLAGGRLAMGRYEVTVGEYRTFAAAAGGGAGGGCITFGVGDSWRDPGIPQTDRHPVTCVNWDDAQAYVSWLSRTTGAAYGLPTEAEWERAAAGSQPGCDRLGRGTIQSGTCPVGASVANAAGLSDMVGNVWEWTQDCWEGDCGRRMLRGGSWNLNIAEDLRPSARVRGRAGARADAVGFRVSRTLD